MTDFKKGGPLQNSNIFATNRLFVKNKLFKKRKKKRAPGVYNPKAKFKYEDGGEKDYIELDLSEEDVQKYIDGGYIVEEVTDPSIATLNRFIDGGALNRFDNGGDTKPGVQNLSEATIYDPKTKKEQLNLFQQLKAAKNAYQDFTKQNKGKKWRLTSADNASSDITTLKKSIQLYKDELKKEQEEMSAEKAKLERLKKKLSDNKDIQNLNLKDLNTVKGKMKIEDALRNSNLDSSTVAAIYKGYGLVDVDANVKKDYSAKAARQAWGDPEEWKKFNNMVSNVATAIPLLGAAGAMGGAGAAILENPYVQAGLTGYGLYDATTNTLPEAYKDLKEGNYWEAAGNTALAGLDLVPGIGLAGKGLGKAVDLAGDAGKFITTQTPFKNAYKLNPRALKENPEMYVYRARPVGQNPDMNMAATLRAKEAAGEPLNWRQKNIIKMSEGKVPDMGGIAAREKYYGRWFDKDPKNLDYYINPDTRNFADNDAIEILRSKLPKAEADKLKVSQFEDAKSLSGFPEREFILPKDLVNSAERFPESSWQQLIQEDKAFNTPHWLKGYKKVSTELPGSPNTSISGRLKQFFDRPPGPLMLGMPTSSGSNMVKKNMNYYKQLLDSYDGKKMSISDRKFYNSLIETGKKQDGMVTEAQVRELDRLKTGNFDFGKKGYSLNFEQILKLPDEDILNKTGKSKEDWELFIEAKPDKYGKALEDTYNSAYNPTQEQLANIEAGKQQLLDFYSSGEYNRRLQNGIPGLSFMDTHNYQNNLINAINKTKPRYVQSKNYGTLESDAMAYTSGADASGTKLGIDFSSTGLSRPDAKYLASHEYGHASLYDDKNKKLLENLPKLSLDEETLKNWTKWGKESGNKAYDDMINYYSNPDEARQRGINAILYSKEAGISTDDLVDMPYNQVIELSREGKIPKDIAELRQIYNQKELKDYLKKLYSIGIPTAGVIGTATMLANPFEGSNGLPQQKKGGSTNDYIEIDIPEEEIQKYIDQGYIVEPVSKLKKFIS